MGIVFVISKTKKDWALEFCKSFHSCIYIQKLISTHFVFCGVCDFSLVLKLHWGCKKSLKWVKMLNKIICFTIFFCIWIICLHFDREEVYKKSVHQYLSFSYFEIKPSDKIVVFKYHLSMSFHQICFRTRLIKYWSFFVCIFL